MESAGDKDKRDRRIDMVLSYAETRELRDKRIDAVLSFAESKQNDTAILHETIALISQRQEKIENALLNEKFPLGLVPRFEEHVEVDLLHAKNVELNFEKVNKNIAAINSNEENKKYFKTQLAKYVAFAVLILGCFFAGFELYLHVKN